MPVPTLKAASGGADSVKVDDKSGSADAGAATPIANQAQPSATPAQPVAAAIVPNTTFEATPPTANAPASGTTIGEPAKSRAKVTLLLVGGQDAPPAQDATEAAAAKSAPAAPQSPSADEASAAKTSDSGSPGNTANAPAPSAGPAEQQQAQAQVDNDAGVLAQTDAASQAGTDHTAPRGDAVSATSAPDTAAVSGAQTASGAANIDGLPNFGFSSANTATPLAAAATPGSAAAASVPVAGLAVAIAARALTGSNQFDIRLSPPELGRIDVRLDVDRNGQVTSHVTVDRVDTLQLLQSQQPQLERALEQAGLKTADNGLQFTLRDQSFAGQNGNGGSGSAPQNAAQLVIPEAELAPVAATEIYSRLSLSGGVDIRV